MSISLMSRITMYMMSPAESIRFTAIEVSEVRKTINAVRPIITSLNNMLFKIRDRSSSSNRKANMPPASSIAGMM